MDKVSDLLVRIKNGYLASQKEVKTPYSKLSWVICQLLKREGYLLGCEVTEREIKITLKYNGKQPVLTDVKRISKPSQRVYVSKTHIPYVFEGLGIALISTPKGLMTDRQARKEGIGGEVMAYVW